MRDPRYDILFEPVRIGPKVAKNRFSRFRTATAAATATPRRWSRCTDQGRGRLGRDLHRADRDPPDLRDHALHRAAAVGGQGRPCARPHGRGDEVAWRARRHPACLPRDQRPQPLLARGPAGRLAGPILTFTADPVQARALDRDAIRELRGWFRAAFRRSRQAGFDLICLYGAHGFGIFQHFLSRAHQPAHRRIRRQPREPLPLRPRDRRGSPRGDRRRARHQPAPVAPRGRTARALQCRATRLHRNAPRPAGPLGSRAWHLGACSGTSRFTGEGAQEPCPGIKALTDKPVVGVGRFTSADAMVRQVRQGILDFIGAARPSIADPFLPKKIEEGRFEDIRECIGCNICVSGDMTGAISRCTQNSAFMEEWRKGWHPERVRAEGTVGDCADRRRRPGRAGSRTPSRQARLSGDARRGRHASRRPGRARARLPGLAAWGRVADYRAGQIAPMPNVEVYFDSRLEAEDVLAMGADMSRSPPGRAGAATLSRGTTSRRSRPIRRCRSSRPTT